MFMNSKHTTFVDLLGERGATLGDVSAFLFLEDGEIEGDRLTYQQLDQRARSLAVRLQQVGATGGRALLLYPAGLEFIAAFCGCLYAGVTAVPVNPPRRNQSAMRLQAIVTNAQATVILTTASLQAKLGQSLNRLPALATLTWLVTDESEGEQVAELAARWSTPAIDQDTLAFLQYTSGTTGQPKGVMVSHKNLLENQRLIEQRFQHDRQTRFVGWLPLYHDMGLIGNVLHPLYLGVTSILMSPLAFLINPYRWLWAISKYRASTSGGPNFAYDLCLQKITPEERESLDLTSWEIAFNGAEPVRTETLEQFSQVFASCGFAKTAFYPCYGLAEATLLVSGGDKTQPPLIKHVSRKALGQNQVVEAKQQLSDLQTLVACGTTALNHRIVIADPNNCTLCPAGAIGEIWVAGPSVAQGYWNRKAETEKTFSAYLTDGREGPFLRTGDLGFQRDGQLFVTGRLKDVIIIHGCNYYPQDIEAIVAGSHPLLRPHSGSAFSVTGNGYERLVIVHEVERLQRQQLDIKEIVGDIRQVVAVEYGLQIHEVVLIKAASIPRTSSGKIQRSTCKTQYLEGKLNVVARTGIIN